MSQGNIGFELQNGTLPVPGTTAIQALNVDDATYGKLAIITYTAGVISDNCSAAGKFSPGCMAIDTTGASGANGDASIEYNSGTAASPTWTLIT